MSNHITPTPGRIVWFYPNTQQLDVGYVLPPAGQPLAAIVAGVRFDDMLFLTVFDASGSPVCALDPVPLIQEGQDVPASGHYATWMPYQKQQAEKAEGARQLAVASDREADDKRWRAGMLDMALRTPGMNGHHDVLRAAAAYSSHIEGEAGPAKAQPAPGAAHPGYSSMQPHQQRVVDERAALGELIEKLAALQETPIFAGLDGAEQDRLRRQENAMFAYRKILGERIAAFALGADTSGLPG